MGLTRTEQTEALTHLLKEDYDAYGRLIEDTQSLSREQKIDFLYRGLSLAGLRVRLTSSDEQVQHAREELASVITAGAQVLLMRRRSEAAE